MSIAGVTEHWFFFQMSQAFRVPDSKSLDLYENVDRMEQISASPKLLHQQVSQGLGFRVEQGHLAGMRMS